MKLTDITCARKPQESDEDQTLMYTDNTVSTKQPANLEKDEYTA